ncbi:EF-P 5-aminopentanol modification-associated protein YfmH [Pallidibacillus pasinlerensis]|uniref:Insulinase family protein n=1 Tax=Pallidibacillus pasinlerensis TaxID=2703818 RepID=A0ABW9ZZF3_9BACI|nr:pitrilysin family protein [Pallidibacillus pasinlerensis]NCU16466.1 insulinase family protein [Pallidibacillus pasinlerensis]
MEKIEFKQLGEELYYEKLDNGLDVYCLPKKGFNKTFITFTTKYGSVDNHFVPLGSNEYKIVPDGIAHFLEHKMFEKEDGDVFQQFTKQGASANAFTSFTRTAYLFSSTLNVYENLKTLIDMVQQPYFTEQTVEKEKGIIGQEIQMYNDNPDWRLYFGTIENMYHNHPVKIDIAGTIESIADITSDLLYECYNTFYHPSNMLLFVVGPVDPKEMIDTIRVDQAARPFTDQPEIRRYFDDEPETVAEKEKVLKMNVQTPKCMVGLKGNFVNQKGDKMLKTELSAQLLLDLLFSRSSENYRDLYDEGLIDDSFSYDYTQEESFGFVLVGGDTTEPDKLESKIKEILLKAKTHDNLSESALTRIKKHKIGTFLRALNSPEFIANQFTRYAFNEMDLFRVVPILEEITFDDVKKVATTLIAEERLTVCKVLPKN